MNRRWIIAGLLVFTVSLAAAFALWGPDRDWERREHRVEVVEVVDEGGDPVEGASTIFVEGDRHFFPVGLFLIPLFLILIGGLFGRAFRGHPGGGPWGTGGGGTQWLDEWHERRHREMANATQPPSTEPS